jgi:predicted unusual protein kinase regulating ubiquinone biosynthesis (AarF/ABC1/UbiB family)
MSDKNGAKPTIRALKTRPLERNLALTRLGLGAGGKIAAHSLANIFRGSIARDQANRDFYQRQAQVLADELGRLKGSVMKAGQMLSLYGQYFLPEEAVAVLSGLQDDTPAVEWRVVAPVLERALGRARLRELEVEQRPLAAASLGQAHRARRKKDGLELVVKIQYPGVADAIESDIKTLSRLLLVTRLAPKGLDLDPIFNEVREMLHREVDYEHERHFTETFAQKVAADERLTGRFVVPRVLGEYSADMVLTTTYEHGCSVRDARVRALPQARRSALGRSFLELFLAEFFRWGLVQSDPHFGNYRFRLGEDGAADQVVLLDFGATRVFGRGFVENYARIVRGALTHDRQEIWGGARAIGLMDEKFPRSVLDAFAQMCELIVEPFADPESGAVPPQLKTPKGEYRWGESDLPMRASKVAAVNALSVHFRVPPREIVFLHRRLAGVFIMLATLGAELDARALLDHEISALTLSSSR